METRFPSVLDAFEMKQMLRNEDQNQNFEANARMLVRVRLLVALVRVTRRCWGAAVFHWALRKIEVQLCVCACAGRLQISTMDSSQAALRWC